MFDKLVLIAAGYVLFGSVSNFIRIDEAILSAISLVTPNPSQHRRMFLLS